MKHDVNTLNNAWVFVTVSLEQAFCAAVVKSDTRSPSCCSTLSFKTLWRHLALPRQRYRSSSHDASPSDSWPPHWESPADWSWDVLAPISCWQTGYVTVFLWSLERTQTGSACVRSRDRVGMCGLHFFSFFSWLASRFCPSDAAAEGRSDCCYAVAQRITGSRSCTEKRFWIRMCWLVRAPCVRLVPGVELFGCVIRSFWPRLVVLESADQHSRNRCIQVSVCVMWSVNHRLIHPSTLHSNPTFKVNFCALGLNGKLLFHTNSSSSFLLDSQGTETSLKQQVYDHKSTVTMIKNRLFSLQNYC